MVGQGIHHRAGSARVAWASGDPFLDFEVVGLSCLARQGGSRCHQVVECVKTHLEGEINSGNWLGYEDTTLYEPGKTWMVDNASKF